MNKTPPFLDVKRTLLLPHIVSAAQVFVQLSQGAPDQNICQEYVALSALVFVAVDLALVSVLRYLKSGLGVYWRIYIT
jgi:hypothetical protein